MLIRNLKFTLDIANSRGVGSDKLSRLASHVLTQQTYYPLWPAPAPHALDAALWTAHAQLSCTPHVLVTPSNFRYFVKVSFVANYCYILDKYVRIHSLLYNSILQYLVVLNTYIINYLQLFIIA